MNDNGILLIYTGGTIGMSKMDSNNGFLKNGEEVMNEILNSLNLNIYDRVVFTSKIIDSSQIDFSLINEILSIIETNYSDYKGFLIVSGTDTMAYIQSLVKWQIKGLNRPIILTGAINSYNKDKKEGINNIKFAYSQLNLFKEQGLVGICMNSHIMLKPTTKNNSLSESPYIETQNSSLEKYRIDHLVKQKIFFNYLKDIKIEIIYLNPFIYVPDNLELTDGLILLTYGQGTILDNIYLKKRINLYSKRRKPIVVLSQCFFNEMDINQYYASIFLKEIKTYMCPGSCIEEGIAFINYLISNNILISYFN